MLLSSRNQNKNPTIATKKLQMCQTKLFERQHNFLLIFPSKALKREKSDSEFWKGSKNLTTKKFASSK